MPIQCEYFAMEGTHSDDRDHPPGHARQPGKQLEFGGIVLTMYDPSLELTAEVDQEVRELLSARSFSKRSFPRDVAVSEAPSHGRAVIDHAPRTRGARAYIELCMEVMDTMSKEKRLGRGLAALLGEPATPQLSKSTVRRESIYAGATEC